MKAIPPAAPDTPLWASRPLVTDAGIIFFLAEGTLYKSDGTAEGSLAVGVFEAYAPFVGLGSKVLFKGYDDEHGDELWVSDGTAGGTRLLRDIHTGDPLYPDPSYSSYLEELTPVGSAVFFKAESYEGSELWRTNGTTAGTRLVKDIVVGGEGSYPSHLTAWNGEVYFTSNAGLGDSWGLWRSDGTAAGTILVKALQDERFLLSDLWHGATKALVAAPEVLFFFTCQSYYIPEPSLTLWRSDGTEEGTVSVKTLSTEEAATIGNSIAMGDGIFFLLRTEVGQLQLWKSDGTEPGTVRVGVLCGEAESSECDNVGVSATCAVCGPPASLGFSVERVPLGTPEPFEGLAGVDRSRSCGPCLASDAEVVVAESETDVYLNIVSQFPGGRGVATWMVGVSIDGDATLVEASTEGTAAVEEPEGYKTKPDFDLTVVIDPAKNGGMRGAVSTVILSMDENDENGVTLPPRGTESILRIRVRSTSEGGEGAATLRVLDGLVGRGGPITNSWDWRWYTGQQRFGNVWGGVGPSLTIRFSQGGRQLPGDCNQDGTLDLSDAVCVFGALFLGMPDRLPCGDGDPREAGNITLLDWQPDGEVDLSDGVAALQNLFSGGPPHAAVPAGGSEASCISIPGCPSITSCP